MRLKIRIMLKEFWKRLTARHRCALCEELRPLSWIHVEAPNGITDQWKLCAECAQITDVAEVQMRLYHD